MSLINKMLRELDKRHAAPAAAASQAPSGTGTAVPAAPPLTQTLRPVKGARIGSDLFWWVMAAVMLVAIAWIGWVMWQLSPRSVVNEVALRPFPTAPVARPAASVPALPPRDAPVDAPTVVQSENLPPARGGVDMLRLATEITTPITARPKPPAVPPQSRTVPEAASSAAKAPASGAVVAPLERMQSATPARPAPPSSTGPDNARIDKRAPASGRDRAESEYRRAVTLVNQGRVSEGMDALRGALAADAAYEPARQTLVALLVEQRRFEDAVAVLQEGLNLRPGNSDFAMLLARILVDRQDVSGALAVLQKHAPAAGTKADYHGFAAALHQRLGQHKEAMDEYQAALRLSPQSGVWWVGLGISQEAAERRKEAAESFRRARASGSLNGDLLTYVDQRLRQLQ